MTCKVYNSRSLNANNLLTHVKMLQLVSNDLTGNFGLTSKCLHSLTNARNQDITRRFRIGRHFVLRSAWLVCYFDCGRVSNAFDGVFTQS